MIKYLLITLLFLSCTTVKKSINCLDDHRTDAAKYCSERFPIKERTVTKTEYKAGKETVREIPGETVYIDCDSAVKATLDEASKKHIAVKCPTIKEITIVDTFSIHDTVYSENTAKVEYLQLCLSAKTNEAVNNKAWGKKWQVRALFGWAMFLLACIGIGAIMRFR